MAGPFGSSTPESEHGKPTLRHKRLSTYDRLVRAEVAALTGEQRAILRSIAENDNINIFFGDYFGWKRTHNVWRGEKQLKAMRCLGEYLQEYRTLYKPYYKPLPPKG